jgi:hypothetical protein
MYGATAQARWSGGRIKISLRKVIGVSSRFFEKKRRKKLF